MNYAKRLTKRLLREEDGPTAPEYAIMLALIIVGCISAILLSGGVSQEIWEGNADEVENVFNN